MADGDSWDSQLLTGLAELLHAESLGVWRPSGSGVYLPSETAIVVGDIIPAPDRLITLASYPVDSPRGMQDIVVGVQFRLRGTPDARTVIDLGSNLFDALDNSGQQTWGDIAVTNVYRRSHTPLGRDGKNRCEASHNYYVEAMRPTVHRYR
jgi:hypothetical protein